MLAAESAHIKTLQSQQTHMPEPGKTSRTNRQLQPCKSQPKMYVEHCKEATALGTCRHCRAAGVTIGGLTKECQEETKDTNLQHFIG